MIYKQFEELIIFLKNSVNPDYQLNKKTIEIWHKEYFQFYEYEQLNKVFKHMAENEVQPILKNILENIVKFYGFLLHEEVVKANKIYEQSLKEGIETQENNIPILSLNLDRPQRQAWNWVVKTKGGE